MPESVDPRELFERVKALWPRSIAYVKEPLETLNAIYWPLEERLSSDDEWISLGAWAFHQSLFEFAKASKKADFLNVSDLPFEIFDRNMKTNLADSSWDNWRPLYRAC